MADTDRLSSSLQESVLTLLCFNDKEGNLVAGLVTPELFEEPYRDIAARALEYRQKHREPPGQGHIDDLFDHILDDPNNRRAATYRRLLEGMLRQSEHLNAEYVASRVTEFVRRQTLKVAIVKAAERYKGADDQVAEDVEKILFTALRKHADSFDEGTRLTDVNKSLSFLTREGDILKLGIPELDRVNLGPARKELSMLQAPYRKGKSWWCNHNGTVGILARENVLHLTLENSEEITAQRYMQTLFGMAKRPDEFEQTVFEIEDHLHRMIGMRREKMRPVLDMKDKHIRQKLTDNIAEWGLRLDSLIIKQFPTGQLTIPKMTAYLDVLERSQSFVPDMVIVDYPRLFKLDPERIRTDLGQVVIDLRGLAVERNFRCVAVMQANREGMKASTVRGHHTSEDASQLMTADTIITYSQTDREDELDVARLFVEKNRNDEGGFTVLIAQSYNTGQFCIQSAPFSDKYWEYVGKMAGDGSAEEESDPKDGGRESNSKRRRQSRRDPVP